MGSSTGDLLVPDDEGVAEVLASGRRRVAVHAEDEPRMRERHHLVAGGAPVAMHPEWRDVETALRATRRLVALAERHARPVHVLHITTADEMRFLAEHRRLATVETTPQHLTLSAPDCYERLGALAQMNPPIRDEGHRKGLWEAVRGGVVDVIGSDHAPHTLEEKAKPYPGSPSGMGGVQTLVPLLLDHVHEGRLSLARFVDLTSAGAARIYNIAGKGRIALGYDADFTVVDLEAARTIENRWIRSRSGWTPFDGMRVRGWPIATVVRGGVTMRDDELLGPPRGRPVAFWDCHPGPGES
jgi:dihydroorotase